MEKVNRDIVVIAHILDYCIEMNKLYLVLAIPSIVLILIKSTAMLLRCAFYKSENWQGGYPMSL